MTRIAVTGATGFVGRHVVDALEARGDTVVPVSRGRRDPNSPRVPIDDAVALEGALRNCDTVVHLAGISFERDQTFVQVHVNGTAALVAAARRAGVRRIVMLSFLGARPACGSAYHETKWAAEELIRNSGLGFTIVKAGMIVGDGDHGLDVLSRTLRTLPLFLTLRDSVVAPVVVEDVTNILVAAADGRLDGQTIAAVGPEALPLAEMARIVARAQRRRIAVLPAPVALHRVIAISGERLLHVPLASRAQLRMLRDGIVAASTPVTELPPDLRPSTQFDERYVRTHAPQRRFRCQDFRTPLYARAA